MVDVSIELVTVSITRIADARAGSPTIISVPLANPSSSEKKSEACKIETLAVDRIIVQTLQCHPQVGFRCFSHLFGTGHVEGFRGPADFRIDQRRR